MRASSSALVPVSSDGPCVVLATRNAGKVHELQPLLAAVGVRLLTLDALGLPESVEEDALEAFGSFEENALAKARYFARRTGAIVLADDSGLAVDALDGRPGVHSKRWSGRADLQGAALDAANNLYLQQVLAQAAVAASAHGTGLSRRARYVCAAACAWSEGGIWRDAVVRGETTGELLAEPRGREGFGYDPYFLSHDLGVTFAEVDRSAKARVSHRGRAFSALLQLESVRACIVPAPPSAV